MKSVVFRVRREYFDAIISGEKDVEYRSYTEFWKKRLSSNGPRIAVFVCGKRVHRREILYVTSVPTPEWFSQQGKQDVNTETCYAIYLGKKAT